VLVRFESISAASKAMEALNGRDFDGRTVRAPRPSSSSSASSTSASSSSISSSSSSSSTTTTTTTPPPTTRAHSLLVRLQVQACFLPHGSLM